MEKRFLEHLRDAARASPAEMVLLVVVGIAILGGSALVLIRRSDPPPPRIERTGTAAAGGITHVSKAGPPSRKTVVVHVAGLVAAPGVYELPGDSRVKDAIAAAGGPKDGGDVDALNLAAPLTDGQKITVGKPGHGTAPPEGAYAGTSGSGQPVAGQKIDLNTATAAELDTLPSIGPVLAERILSFRQKKGGFTSVSELRDIEGIGPKKYEGIKDLVTV